MGVKILSFLSSQVRNARILQSIQQLFKEFADFTIETSCSEILETGSTMDVLKDIMLEWMIPCLCLNA